MVGLGRVRGDNHENANNGEEIVDNGPPSVGGELVLSLDLGDDGRDEGDDPRELRMVSDGRRWERGGGREGVGVVVPAAGSENVP